MDPKTEESLNPREEWKKIEAEVHHNVIQKGLYAAAQWGTAGVATHFLLTSKFPRYKRHTFPFKLFVMLMIPTAAFFTVTDIAAMEADREFALKYSISTKEDLVLPHKPIGFSREYFQENQFKLIGLGWAGLVGGTLIYNFSKPQITMTQKLINARMVGQAGALVGIVAIAAFSIKRNKPVAGSVPNDAHFDRIVKRE